MKKISKSMVICSMFAMSFMGLSSEALAEAPIWKINVPVELKDLSPKIEKFMVAVDVKKSDGTVLAHKGSVYTALESGGHYSGTLTLLVYPDDLKSKANPAEAALYTVKLHFISEGAVTGPDSPKINVKSQFLSAFGTPRVLKVTEPMKKMHIGKTN